MNLLHLILFNDPDESIWKKVSQPICCIVQYPGFYMCRYLCIIKEIFGIIIMKIVLLKLHEVFTEPAALYLCFANRINQRPCFRYPAECIFGQWEKYPSRDCYFDKFNPFCPKCHCNAGVVDRFAEFGTLCTIVHVV